MPTANCGENMHCTYIICPQWQVQSFAANAPLEVRHYLPHKAEDAEPLHDWALTTLLDDIRVRTWSLPEPRHSSSTGGRMGSLVGTFIQSVGRRLNPFSRPLGAAAGDVPGGGGAEGHVQARPGPTHLPRARGLVRTQVRGSLHGVVSCSETLQITRLSSDGGIQRVISFDLQLSVTYGRLSCHQEQYTDPL